MPADRSPPVAGERPTVRLRLLPVLAATTAATVAYFLGSSLNVMPPRGFAVVLFAATPTLAIAATVLAWLRARDEQDNALQWATTGLSVACVAMVLQLISFPLVAPGGGILGTGGQGSALLYLGWHLALALGAIAGAYDVSSRLIRPALALGVLAAVLAAVPALAPRRPQLLRADGSFTGPLVLAELAVATATVAAVLLWARANGTRPSATRGWLTVALALSTYDLVLNIVAHQRFTAIWWSSLGLRVATYAVLLGGLLWATARQLTHIERYARSRLALAAGEVRSWTDATERLLAASSALSGAVSPEDVARVLVDIGAGIVGGGSGSVLATDADDHAGSPPLRWLPEATPPSAGGTSEVRRRASDAAVAVSALQSGAALFVDDATVSTAGAPVPAAGCLAAIPLLAGETPVGALVVVGSSPHRFSRLDRELLSAIGRQGAQALQRSLLYERQRSAATTLQRALLPQQLPSRADVVFAARYRPASRSVDVGGDWYDVLEVDAQRLMLVVGDVMGKGVPAAILMGHMRSAVRTLVALDPRPTAVLTGLDRLATGFDDDLIVTVVLLLVDSGSERMTVGNAGHLPPMVLRPTGLVEEVLDDAAPPIGAPSPIHRTDSTARIPAGCTVLVTTDGLVEDRRRPLDAMLHELSARAQRLLQEGRALDEVADALVAGRAHRDDVTLLLAHLPATAADEVRNDQRHHAVFAPGQRPRPTADLPARPADELDPDVNAALRQDPARRPGPVKVHRVTGGATGA